MCSSARYSAALLRWSCNARTKIEWLILSFLNVTAFSVYLLMSNLLHFIKIPHTALSLSLSYTSDISSTMNRTRSFYSIFSWQTLLWTKISIASRNGSLYALQCPFCSPHCSITIQTNINPREHTRVHTRAHTEVIPQIPSLTANLSPPPHQPALLSNGSVIPSLTCSLLVCKSHTSTHTY